MTRHSVSLGRNWEKTVQFGMGVVASGRFLHTSGITARNSDGDVICPGDMPGQVKQCFANLGAVLDAVGATWGDVVKYTFFTTDIDLFLKTGREVRAPYMVNCPACTTVEVRRLFTPETLIEVEAIVCLPEKR